MISSKNKMSSASSRMSTTPLTEKQENSRLRNLLEELMTHLETTTVRMESTREENKLLESLLSQSEAQVSHEKRAKECLYAENQKKDAEISKLLSQVVHLQNELRKAK